ncbi:MAG: ATP synthase F0 subunit A, F-type H+-transporting ATPase subunit a [Candidatus Beckwithbacteria bacterium GW2011_GWC1_49_16]|nr:MAG: ATP synthase F0 subunit A, F-type H+-transporting ATPase subunit a [Candidatus Beckwithbacteria bacterium GW2011_GWC1_49_16]
MAELHISISAEPIFNLGHFEFTNSMLVSLLVSAGLSLVAIRFYQHLKQNKKSNFALFVATVIESLYEFVQSVTPHHAGKFFPLFTTIFLFVIFGSWAELLPGLDTIGLIKVVNGQERFVPLLRAATADVHTTLAIAIFAMASVQIYGYKYQGISYFKKFFNLTNPINFFVGFLEIIAEFSRLISFTFRLFGNIFAGEVLLIVIAFLLPLFGPLPFVALEIFVGFIQALVFAMLTLVFINIAVSSEHH